MPRLANDVPCSKCKSEMIKAESSGTCSAPDKSGRSSIPPKLIVSLSKAAGFGGKLGLGFGEKGIIGFTFHHHAANLK